MKTPDLEDVKKEMDDFRRDIEADIDHVKGLIDPEKLRKKATDLAKGIWEDKRKRWTVLGFAGAAIILWLFLRKRNEEPLEVTDKDGKTTRIVLSAQRPGHNLLYELAREALRVFLLTLARKMLSDFLANRKAKKATQAQ
jgi:hypothetical protein